MTKCRRCEKPSAPKTRGYCRYCYKQSLRKRVEAGLWISGRVPTGPVIAHVKKLRAAGLGYRRIGELAEIDCRVVQRMHRQQTVYATTAARLMAVPVPMSPHTVASSGAQVAVIGTQRRLRALVAIGYPQHELGTLLDSNDTRVWMLISGYQEYVSAEMAQRVDTLFTRLQLAPRDDMRAKRRAERKGWAPPFAWDEDTIDDPTAESYIGEEATDWFDQFQDLRDSGVPAKVAAERLGVKWNTVDRRLARNGAA